MSNKGYVINFRNYTPAQLEQAKKDLGLNMPLSMLAFCANYFKSHEKRDPAIEELAFFDLLNKKLENDPDALAITELMTNDAFVARTYNDIMQKRHALYPTAKKPIGIREAFFQASAYLMRSGKESALQNLSASLETDVDRLVSESDNTAVSDGDTAIRLRKIRKEATEDRDGDALLLLLSSPSENPAHYDMQANRLLANPDLTKKIKRVHRIGENGLLYELMQICKGVTLSLPRLSRHGEPMPLSMLVNAYQGKYLVRMSEEDAIAFETAVLPMDLRAMRFAYTTSSERVDVIQEPTRRFSWSIDFLRALRPTRAVKALLTDEAPMADAPICHCPIATNGSEYLSFSPTRKSDTLYDGTLLTAIASSQPDKDFFKNALDTALTAVLTLSVSGCHYSEQRLAVALTLPQNLSDSRIAGESISTILGLYRLQAELGLPLITGTINALDHPTHPQMATFALANGTPCPIHWQNEGNYVYCVMPQLQQDGLPNFYELRNLLSYLADLRNRHVLQSARILCRESITDALIQMRTDALSCRFVGDTWAAQGKLPLAILLETTEPLTHGKQVARIVKRADVLSEKEDFELPPTEPLIRSKNTTVTVVSNKGDCEARKLSHYLTLRGATVNAITLTKVLSLDLLAESIFSSQTLIICRDISLPHSAQVDFAVDSLVRGGGRILFPLRKNPDDSIGGIALEKGLNEKMIDQICGLKK